MTTSKSFRLRMIASRTVLNVAELDLRVIWFFENNGLTMLLGKLYKETYKGLLSLEAITTNDHI